MRENQYLITNILLILITTCFLKVLKMYFILNNFFLTHSRSRTIRYNRDYIKSFFYTFYTT